ncbi:PDZ domain-containing protein [Cryobacterium sp. 10C3]|uniref:PDZ domain-containing protein n=1 Tax=Cryobacterium sp. 10C3 TaxID=3048577 RepID=UPI003A0FECE6
MITAVVAGSAAATAGIVAGDTITAVDGTSITSAAALTSTLTAYNPGDSVTLTWTDTAGAPTPHPRPSPPAPPTDPRASPLRESVILALLTLPWVVSERLNECTPLSV